MNSRARDAVQDALPGYEVAGELGRGAFGVVYEARHTQLGRHVAIKQLPQAFAADPDVRERFVAEARTVASLDHPHIVPVYDFVESEGACLLIMERCEGSVGDRFKEEGIVTDEACAAVLACLAALDYAHAGGLLHRDIKPENLMYDNQGVVKLGDFGIARALDADIRRTATGMVVGTPAYMSPEQCRGDELTTASDVYSVGMMAYELMTGGLPFPETTSVNGLLAHHLVTEPTPLLQIRPELPGSIGRVVDRALSKDLEVRYSTAEEMAVDLARACVTAFGSGWLRRRRFILHWPEIIAETERPDAGSPRTGTIMVRAGDVPHAVITPEQALEGEQQPRAESADATTPAVAAGDDDTVRGGTLVDRPADAGRPMADVSSAPPPAAAPPTPPQQPAGPMFEQESGGPNKAVLAGVAAAALIAVIIAVVVFTGGGDSEPATGLAAGDIEATPAAPETPAEAPADEPAEQPTASDPADEAPTPATTDPAPTTPPVVAADPLLTTRPPDLDTRVADSPWVPTPCPEEPERVACILAGVATDEETGEILVPYFTEGFIPELEPADYHIHFYLDTEVNGDETKAGTETPGGTWKNWDSPFPATSFGGDNGRSLYTIADYEAVGARYLCAIVADPEQRAIPGTGNCAPLAQLSDLDLLSQQVNRLEGSFVGRCAVGVTAIAPEGWRWFDLVELSVDEAAALIRPTDAERAAEAIGELVADGGVVFADGPVDNDYQVNFSLSTIPGEFELDDTPAEVAETLSRLGIQASGATGTRTLVGRDIATQVTERGNIRTFTYVVPDFGYAIVLDFHAPQGSGWAEVAESVAATIVGC